MLLSKAILVASVLAASSLANAVVLSTRQTASSGPTCFDKAVGATFSTKLAPNHQYDVTCGADYSGNDIRLEWVADFVGCLTACDAEAQCDTVAYVDYACYLKNGVPDLETGIADVWSAKKIPPPTCDGNASDGAIYFTSVGNFQIICGRDYNGNDFGGISTASFAECIDTCAAYEKCVDVSFQYGACYPKYALNDTLSEVGSVWTAKFLGTRTIPTSSTVVSSIADGVSIPEVAKSISCLGDTDNDELYIAANGGAFTIECGVDHWGADIGTTSSITTFEECMDNCDASTECVIVSWVWGNCYMKNAVNDGHAVRHVWTGKRTSRAIVSSPSSIRMSSVAPAAYSTTADSTSSVMALETATVSTAIVAAFVDGSASVSLTPVFGSSSVSDTTFRAASVFATDTQILSISAIMPFHLVVDPLFTSTTAPSADSTKVIGAASSTVTHMPIANTGSASASSSTVRSPPTIN